MKKFWIVSVLVGLALLLGMHSPPPAAASPYLEVVLNDGINPAVVVQDGGIGDVNPTVGAVTAVTSIGGWLVNVATGLTYPNGGGNMAMPFLDLSSVNITSAAGGFLTVMVDAIGYTGPISAGLTGPFSFAAGGTVGGETTGIVGFTAAFSTDNMLFGDGGSFSPFGFLGPFVSDGTIENDEAFAGSANIPAFSNASAPYGLMIVAGIGHDGAGSTSFDTSLTASAVPEPSILLLIGPGLVGLVALKKRFTA